MTMQPRQHELTLKDLPDLDGGRIAVAFDSAIRRAALDCEDRPGETRPRKVTLQCEVAPVCDDDGVCRDVHVSFQVKDAVPTRKSKVYSMALRKQGMLVFSDVTSDGSESLFDGESE